MTTPAHVETFISIVVGLALTDVAQSLHRLLRAGRRVRWDLLTPLAALLVTCAVINTWWTLDRVFSYAVTFAAFLPNFGSLILLYLLASATLPDKVPDEGLDLKAYYLENRTYFWGLFVLWALALVANEAALSAAQGRPAARIFAAAWPNLPFIALFALLMWTRRRWLHGAVLVVTLVVIVGSWAFNNPTPPT